jgi:NitT/TauT family transport system substrate-binding protein
VTEAETPLVPNSVVQLAKPLGYYDRERVGVEIMHVGQTPLAIAALISGAADMANVGVDALLHFATRSDVRIKAVMSPNKTLPFLIAARRNIGSWASLPGRDDLHVLVTASEFHATLPFVSKLNAVRDATIAERRPEIGAVVRALIAAGRDFHADERRWTSAMRAARPDVPAEILDRLAPEFRDGWCVNGGLNRQELVATQDWIFREPDFAGLKPPPLHDWVDFSFVDQALADLQRIDGLDTPVR